MIIIPINTKLFHAVEYNIPDGGIIESRDWMNEIEAMEEGYAPLALVSRKTMINMPISLDLIQDG